MVALVGVGVGDVEGVMVRVEVGVEDGVDVLVGVGVGVYEGLDVMSASQPKPGRSLITERK
jgi:hypothetical protein